LMTALLFCCSFCHLEVSRVYGKSDKQVIFKTISV
jgi:hypothetical protein